MKHLNFLLILAATFFGSAIVGLSYNLNPVTSGSVGTFLIAGANYAMQKSGQYNLISANGYNIDEVITQLGAYWRKYDKAIMSTLYRGLEFEKYMTRIPGITDEYVSSKGSASDIFQPMQKGFTPKGKLNVAPRKHKVHQLKIDYLIDEMDEWYTTYLSFMAEEGRDRKDWPLVKYIWMEHLVPKMLEELDQIAARGEFQEPIAGTPGAFIDCTDGLLTIAEREIANGTLIPINTGIITDVNILDQVEFFVDSIDTRYRNMKEPLFMSNTNARKYERAYSREFGSTNDKSAKGNRKVDGTNFTIVGLHAFEGTNKFLATPKKNMIAMYDKLVTMNKVDIQKFNRDVKLLGDIKRGYDFRDLEKVFINE